MHHAKKIVGGLAALLLIIAAYFAPPLQSRADPITLILLGSALAAVDVFSCDIEIVFNCYDSDGDGVGDTDVPPVLPPPPDEPEIGEDEFWAEPSIVDMAGDYTTLHWDINSSDEATYDENVVVECVITGGGLDTTVSGEGSLEIGPIEGTVYYTITCTATNEGGSSEPVSFTIRVMPNPNYREI